MYGKLFRSLYDGSMVGKPVLVFAVWPYVIANMEPDREVGFQVHLNPRKLSLIMGGVTPEDIQTAIDVLCAPDPESTTKDEEGKRLVRLGQFTYRVVNGAKYNSIRTNESRREYFRDRYKKQKDGKAHKKGTPLAGEAAFVKAVEDGKNPNAEDYLPRAPLVMPGNESPEIPEVVSGSKRAAFTPIEGAPEPYDEISLRASQAKPVKAAVVDDVPRRSILEPQTGDED